MRNVRIQLVIWFAALVTGGMVLLVSGSTMHAQAPAQRPTKIVLIAPSTTELGNTVLLEARLTDSSGAPLPKAKVYFTMPNEFLSVTGNEEMADAITDESGLAAAQIQIRSSGPLVINAEFDGDTEYAPSKTSTSVTVTGNKQLYQQTAGVRIPGLNAPIFQGSSKSPHWLLSGWPIAAVLMVVWSCFGTAVFFMAKIAIASKNQASPGTEHRR